MRPFCDADGLLLAGGQNYRLENSNQILMRLKVENSGLVTFNKQRSVSKFVEEFANPSDSKLRWLKKSCIFYILVKLRLFLPKPQ